MALKVQFAVYGALNGGNPNECQAVDVTQILQEQIDVRGGTVPINNGTMGGDPSPGNTKHFGAKVTGGSGGSDFACQEGQTIDFRVTETPA